MTTIVPEPPRRSTRRVDADPGAPVTALLSIFTASVSGVSPTRTGRPRRAPGASEILTEPASKSSLGETVSADVCAA